MFPKLRNRVTQGSYDSISDKEEDEATDYVFRILFPNSQSEFGKRTMYVMMFLNVIFFNSMIESLLNVNRYLQLCVGH